MKLARWLAERRLSQEAFAAQVGVSRVSVSHWCRGRSMPRPNLITAIAGATEGKVTAADFRRQRRRRVE